MCAFSKPKTPAVPEVPAPPETPKEATAKSTEARDDARKKALANAGRSGDILTGNYGLADAPAATTKTVLGI
ncbi:conserved hypothetical protein [uncultured Alphaproteobacteria bacterium]|uniref:Uncharacterized protein n=1 Tax=uncultured Alphaproteobacteria bacterium TaxID=91750 RepID=A0A212KM08_9PROT|nr:conserved hypothetical protein [uncultured Alphaproteobacteria bacterium]